MANKANSGNWEPVSEAEWEKIPTAPKKQKESEWDELIGLLVDGQIMSLPIENEKDLKGKRIGISRRASSTNGVKLIFRYDAENQRLAIRLKDEPERPATTEKRGPGRPKKTA